MMNQIFCPNSSSSSCHACQRFIPQLIESYTAIKIGSDARNDTFSIVFISSDKSEADFDKYFRQA